MVAARGDDAVSEIIGFILILAIIAIVASLYLTYVVPSQGRDLEITHMALIQNEFLDYKTSVDSLWINEQNVTIINPFILGTSPGTSQGTFLNLPLFQPLPSSGTMSVNGPNGKNTIKIEAIGHLSSVSPDQSGSTDNNTWNIATHPNHIYVLLTTGQTRSSSSTRSDVYIKDGIRNAWNITISAVPVVDLNATTPKYTTNIVVNASIIKNIAGKNLPVSRELTIKTDAEPGGVVYPVDLMDIIDGIYNVDANITFPQTFIVSQALGSTISSTSHTIEYPYNSDSLSYTHTMGSLEYQSHNNYWIQQNYVYQMGGVFVVQSDGAVAKIPPSITISRNPFNYSIALVQLTDFMIIGNSNVASNGLAHADTTSKVYDGREIPGYANADNVTITVNNANNPSLAPAWDVAMDRIALIAQNEQNTGNIPNNIIISVQHATSPAYQTVLTVQKKNVIADPGLTLVYTPVNLSVYVEPESSGAQPGA
jgi:hypothetical protein